MCSPGERERERERERESFIRNYSNVGSRAGTTPPFSFLFLVLLRPPSSRRTRSGQSLGPRARTHVRTCALSSPIIKYRMSVNKPDPRSLEAHGPCSKPPTQFSGDSSSSRAVLAAHIPHIAGSRPPQLLTVESVDGEALTAGARTRWSRSRARTQPAAVRRASARGSRPHPRRRLAAASAAWPELAVLAAVARTYRPSFVVKGTLSHLRRI